MTTIGIIGAGEVGSEVARAATVAEALAGKIVLQAFSHTSTPHA